MDLLHFASACRLFMVIIKPQKALYLNLDSVIGGCIFHLVPTHVIKFLDSNIKKILRYKELQLYVTKRMEDHTESIF